MLILQWRKNERDGVWNHQRLDCLLNPLFRRRSKKIPMLCVTGLCEGNTSMTTELPVQSASKSEMFPFDYYIMIMPERNLWQRLNLFKYTAYRLGDSLTENNWNGYKGLILQIEAINFDRNIGGSTCYSTQDMVFFITTFFSVFPWFWLGASFLVQAALRGCHP